MKIKLTTPIGAVQAGDVVEAVVAPNGCQGFFFDHTSCGWYAPQGSFFPVEAGTTSEEAKSSATGFKIDLVEKPKKLVVEY
jgi:hypothetical protein